MFYSQLERKNFFDFTWDFLPNFSKNVFRKPFHFYLKKFRRKSSGKIFDIQTFWEPYLKIAILKRYPRAVLSRYLSHLPWRAVPPCKSVWCLRTSPIFGCVILHTWWLLLLLRCLMSEPPEPETCGETSWHVGRHRDMTRCCDSREQSPHSVLPAPGMSEAASCHTGATEPVMRDLVGAGASPSCHAPETRARSWQPFKRTSDPRPSVLGRRQNIFSTVWLLFLMQF